MEYTEINVPEDIVQQMNMERARYLLSTDEMLDEMLSKTQV